MAESQEESDQRLHEVIGYIYEAAMDVHLWPLLLSTLCEVAENYPQQGGQSGASHGVSEGDGLLYLGQESGLIPRAMAELLQPHFKRAISLNRDLQRQYQRSAILSQLFARFPLALVMLSAEGAVLEYNPQFTQLLQIEPRLMLVDGRIAFRDESAQHQWLASQAKVALRESETAAFAIPGEGAFPLSALLYATPCHDADGTEASCLLLCLAVPALAGEIPQQQLAQLFSLTPAEARLLAFLTRGSSLEEYCDEAGMSSNTARSHLKSLFRKTGTNRQGEMVQKVRTSPAMMVAGYRDGVGAMQGSGRDEVMRLHQGLRLADGRWMSYAEYGPADGWPLLFFHSLTGCRLQPPADETILEQLGIRLVVPDRPGFGQSDMVSGGTLLSWADDVAQLLDNLALESVAVLGYTVGGIFAMALGREMPQRVRHLTLVSSMGQYRNGADLDGMVARNRMILTIGRHMPAIIGPFMQLMLDSYRRNPGQYIDDYLQNLPPAEHQALVQPQMREIITEAFLEATRNGVRGMVNEQLLICQPWGFEPEEVSVPVQLWHGKQDVHIPVAMGQRLAAALPHCDLFLQEAGGHFLLFERWREILGRIPPPG